MRVPWGQGEWRRAAVYGLGLSGRAAAALLRSRGVEVVGCDARREIPGIEALRRDPGVELLLGLEPTEIPAGLDGVVLSPGVPPARPLPAAARAAGLPVVAEIELAFALLDGPVLGITGSNGKSTTTALTGEILAAAGFAVEVCGNIGEPLSARVDGPPGRIFVVELSSFQLEGVDRFRPRAAALINLSQDHLDRHPDMASYLAAKERIFARQEAADVAILNADDPGLAGVRVPGRRRCFSRCGPVEDGCWLDGDLVVEAAPGTAPVPLFARSDVPLMGEHNLENAMAAALVALAAGGGRESMVPALRRFRGLPHRMERVAEREGVLWLDDSKGTNLDATARSLEGFPDGRVHLILGGRNKGADPRLLVPVVSRKACRVYLVGEAAAEFAAALGDRVPWETAGTLDRAVASAARRSVRGEVVLLSPACASFDQYTSFGERGDHFQRLVHELPGGPRG